MFREHTTQHYRTFEVKRERSRRSRQPTSPYWACPSRSTIHTSSRACWLIALVRLYTISSGKIFRNLAQYLHIMSTSRSCCEPASSFRRLDEDNPTSLVPGSIFPSKMTSSCGPSPFTLYSQFPVIMPRLVGDSRERSGLDMRLDDFNVTERA